MDKSNKSNTQTYDARLAEVEQKIKEFDVKEQKYKSEIFELDLHRIEQLIDIIVESRGYNGALVKQKVIECCKYFFTQGVNFGQGKDINLEYDSKKHTLLY